MGLRRQVAILAHGLHWSEEEILKLPPERRRGYVEELLELKVFTRKGD